MSDAGHLTALVSHDALVYTPVIGRDPGDVQNVDPAVGLELMPARWKERLVVEEPLVSWFGGGIDLASELSRSTLHHLLVLHRLNQLRCGHAVRSGELSWNEVNKVHQNLMAP